MEVHPSVPAKSVEAFIAYAKGNPGKINLASAGIGSLPHMAGEMFKMMAGVDLFHVPYRGAQVFPALLAGDVQVYFGPLLSSIEFIRAGKLRALAVTTTTRSDALAEVPVLAETLPGFEASAWYGIGAPKNTPAEIIERLNREVGASICRFQIRRAARQFRGRSARRLARRFRKAHLRARPGNKAVSDIVIAAATNIKA